jgi:hypothetical protein
VRVERKDDEMTSPQQIDSAARPGHVPVDDGPAYEPPALRRLGSLQELTAGGSSGPSDGFGGAGAMGSV